MLRHPPLRRSRAGSAPWVSAVPGSAVPGSAGRSGVGRAVNRLDAGEAAVYPPVLDYRL
ncbi:hypothetical protein [Microbacterium sp. Yaish 1]|uniref:hypothetical protein n=1 Tax=Microbacterium sp. Yaish 1 TaxID=2025014 RepID=UPI0015C69072|nr:hypothetical protein [Microbacterium sp. Yaish 1]